jgi:hypothetical protein
MAITYCVHAKGTISFMSAHISERDSVKTWIPPNADEEVKLPGMCMVHMTVSRVSLC